VTEDDEAADGGVVRELQRLGEIGKREQHEQHRDDGEKPSTSMLCSLICHAREASRAPNWIQASNETAGASMLRPLRDRLRELVSPSGNFGWRRPALPAARTSPC